MRFAYGVTVSVERPGGRDRYNNRLPSSFHTVPDCAPAPVSTMTSNKEMNSLAATVEWDLELLCSDPDADFEAQDILTIPGDGGRYQVNGRPERWRNPFTGWAAGCGVRLKAVNG